MSNRKNSNWQAKTILSNYATVREILKFGTSFLKTKGIEQPRLESEVILAFVLRKSREELYKIYDYPLPPDKRNQFAGLLQKRSSGDPVAYLTRKKEFMSLEFMVTPEVFIPRPETECLVEAAIQWLKKNNIEKPLIIDVGTGCGAIAISMAYYLQKSTVYALDISSRALSVARENAFKHNVEQRIIFLQGDLLSPLKKGFKVDVLVSNLPYIPAPELNSLPKEVKKEPLLSLNGGKDGLLFLRRLLIEAPTYLHQGGAIFLEFGQGQAEELKKLACSCAVYRNIKIFPDLSGLSRIIFAEVEGGEVNTDKDKDIKN